MTKLPRVAVILAAGWGTRMLPATKSLAKPMIPVVDRPSIDYLVEDYSNAGIKEFIIVGKQHFEQIEEYFDRQLELEKMLESEGKEKYLKAITKYNQLKFTFVRQSNLGGTGDALKRVMHLIPADEPIVVSYADVLMYPRTALPEMLALYQKYPGTMIPVCPVPASEVIHYGVAKIKTEIEPNFSQIDGIVEKPKVEDAPSNLAFFSPMILSPETLEIVRAWHDTEKKDGFLLTDAMHASTQKFPTYIYKTDAEMLDTGIKSGYVKAQIRYGLDHPDTKVEVLEYIKKVLATY